MDDLEVTQEDRQQRPDLFRTVTSHLIVGILTIAATSAVIRRDLFQNPYSLTKSRSLCGVDRNIASDELDTTEDIIYSSDPSSHIDSSRLSVSDVGADPATVIDEEATRIKTFEDFTTCHIDPSGNMLCWYDKGICTNGEDLYVLDPSMESHPAIEHECLPEIQSRELTFILPSQRIYVPSEVCAHRAYPHPSREIVWTNVLYFARGLDTQLPPFHPDYLPYEFEKLHNPINMMAFLSKYGEFPPEFHNPDYYLVGDGTDRTIDVTDSSVHANFILSAILNYVNWKGKFHKLPELQAQGVARDSGPVKGKWLCGRKGVLGGRTHGVALGILHRHFLRNAVCKKIGSEMCEGNGNMINGVNEKRRRRGWKPKVLVLQREAGQPRAFENFDAMLSIMKEYESYVNITVMQLTASRTPRQQIEPFLDASILVTAYGGAMAHVLFMPDHAVVIEGSSWSAYSNYFFQSILGGCGISYFRIFSYNAGNYWELYRSDPAKLAEVSRKCAELIRTDTDCKPDKTEEGALHMPLERFRMHLLESISIVGVYMPNARCAAWDLDGYEGDELNTTYPERSRHIIEPELMRCNPTRTWAEYQYTLPTRLKTTPSPSPAQ